MFRQTPLNASLWRANAACLGLPLEIFFGPSEGDYDPRPAKKVCRDCSVRVECLDYAMNLEEQIILHGVWGGTGHKERVELLNQKRRKR